MTESEGRFVIIIISQLLYSPHAEGRHRVGATRRAISVQADGFDSGTGAES